MAIDRVCRMEVDEATAKWTSEYQGKTYYFCAPGCKFTFEENPEQFVSEGGDPSLHMTHREHRPR
jgi:YHS domain-containing protein